MGMRREPQSSAVPETRLHSGGGFPHHTGGTYSHGGVMDYTRFPVSEIQNWSMFKNSECSNHFALDHRSWESKVNSRTCDIPTDSREKRFPRLRDAGRTGSVFIEKTSQLPSALPKRVSVEEQRFQKDDRFLRGRQTAYMTYEHFRANGAYDAVQGLSDLFNVRLQNDDVQDFDVRWDEALLSANETPTDTVLEGLYKSKYQDSVQLQVVLALYDQGTAQNNGLSSYSRLKTSVRLCTDQKKRSDWLGSSSQESERKESQRWEESGRLLSVESN